MTKELTNNIKEIEEKQTKKNQELTKALKDLMSENKMCKVENKQLSDTYI